MTKSVCGKEWKRPLDVQVDPALVEASAGSPLLAKLLIRRGIRTPEQARNFLESKNYTPTSPLELVGVPLACQRINKAIESGENITIYGDYDVDGVSGTSVLLTVLRKLGAKVDFYIPNRTDEGYGLNLKAVSVIAAKRRTKLIISCDCGVSNFAEINFAKSLGVDTIVCDHHTMPEILPPAQSIIHPKLLPESHPLYHLPGVGVAYKLCEALLTEHQMPEEVEKLHDLVTLGMIADMVPLVDENRYLVQVGLPKLAASPRPGIQALLAQVGKSTGTDLVGFGIAPRINAVGRLADADQAVALLTTDDASEAEKLAHQLQTENTRRQELCEKIFFAADQMVASKVNFETQRVIAIWSEGWHHGVVGIVASRLVEKYNLPVFIGEIDPELGIVKGSARGIEGIDLYEVLKANEHLLSKWGGHKMAAGFSFDSAKQEAFAQGLVETCNRMLEGQSTTPLLEIEALLAPTELTMELAHTVAKLAPFGIANKKPLLSMSEIACTGVRNLGKDGKHHALSLACAKTGNRFEAVMWNSRNRLPSQNQTIDVVFSADINRYNGAEKLQLVVADWRSTNGETPQVENASKPEITAPANKSAAQQNAQAKPQLAPRSNPEKVPSATTGGDAQPVQVQSAAAAKVAWKDLREHDNPDLVLETAVRKVGARLVVFAEALGKVKDVTYSDRSFEGIAKDADKLLIWQAPPSIAVFRSLVAKANPKEIFLVCGAKQSADDASTFMKKLVALVRFAVNKKEGKAEGEKIAAALATTKMCVALGLTLLNKMNVLEWFAESGTIFLDLLGEPEGKFEDHPEFRQLANCLKEIKEFRVWCAESAIKEIQLAVYPNQIRLSPEKQPMWRSEELSDEPNQYEDNDGNKRERTLST